MKKKVLNLTDDQWRKLEYLSKETGESASTILRLGLEYYYRKYEREKRPFDSRLLNDVLPVSRGRSRKK